MKEFPAQSQNELDQKYRSTVLIVSAQIFFAFLLTTVVWFFVPGMRGADSDLTPLWLLVIFIAVGSFIIRRLLARWDRFRNVKLLKGQKGLLSMLQTNAIILGAFGELIAVVGFAAVVMGSDKLDMLRAAAVSLVVFAINFPRRSIWEKIVLSLNEV